MTIADQSIAFHQLTGVPPGEVFQAFASAAAWCRWCCDEAEIDPRVGGLLVVRTPGYEARGLFTAWQPDSHLAFTWHGTGEPPTQVDVALTVRGAATQMEFRVANLGDREAWVDIAHVFQSAWGRALANMKSVLEGTNA